MLRGVSAAVGKMAGSRPSKGLVGQETRQDLVLSPSGTAAAEAAAGLGWRRRRRGGLLLLLGLLTSSVVQHLIDADDCPV